jgi:hypothetical protein
VPSVPILDSLTIIPKINYDTSDSLLTSYNFNNLKLDHNILTSKSNDVALLKGKRDGAPKFLNTAY